MKLNNSIINQIFADAGIKNHRLLNKHHSQYTEMDIMVLESIKMGKKYKLAKAVKDELLKVKQYENNSKKI